MELEKIIGNRVREARQKREWTQATLGIHLLALLGEPWTAQAVSAAEKGNRDFRASDLYALAVALGQPVEYFFSTDDEIELPGSIVTITDGTPPYAVVPKTAGQTMALMRDWLREPEKKD